MRCRHCAREVSLSFVDLGSAPPSNAYLSENALREPETWYPLRVMVCEHCWLVQTEDYAGREQLFAQDYAYFSSYSTSWVDHARRYVVDMIARFQLGRTSTLVEVAANDGYLLQFATAAGIPNYGIEPTTSTAKAARGRGIEIIEEFFGVALAKKLAAAGRCADLIVANNVLAHVPDINDFVLGVSVLLKPDGRATFEFPHLLNLVEQSQFDTIYHEHYSYLSLTSATSVFEANGLSVFDVEELPTHGGSLRLFAQRKGSGREVTSERVVELQNRELHLGVTTSPFYRGFQDRADRVKNDLIAFLVDAKRRGRRVGAYGAAAKGNTLLNYAGVRPDLLPWVVDRNEAKQGTYLPGSRIPVVAEDIIRAERPDYVLILPWNLETEIASQLAYIREWEGRFAIAVPELRIL